MLDLVVILLITLLAMLDVSCSRLDVLSVSPASFRDRASSSEPELLESPPVMPSITRSSSARGRSHFSTSTSRVWPLQPGLLIADCWFDLARDFP
jgi:hypothetical protein